MRRSIREDLEDATTIMEHLQASFDKLTLKEQVDLGARLRPVVKHCEELDKKIKALIKDKVTIKDGAGRVLGELFKAIVKRITVTTFQSKDLQAADLATYNKYLKESDQDRVTYEPR